MNDYHINPSLTVGKMHPLFKALSWCALAVSDDETRYVLTCIHIEKEGLQYIIVATDGKRLHCAEFDAGLFETDIGGLDAGDYSVVSRSSKSIVLCEIPDASKYPNWRKILPEETAEIPLNVTARTTASICLEVRKLAATDFLVDACGFGVLCKKSEDMVIRYAHTPDGAAILIENDVGKALVMPMRHDGSDIKDAIKATAYMPALKEYCEDQPETETEEETQPLL